MLIDTRSDWYAVCLPALSTVLVQRYEVEANPRLAVTSLGRQRSQVDNDK